MASTTLSSWALLAWKALQPYGLDAKAVFKKAGIDPAKLGDGNARYPLGSMLKLWQECAKATGNPSFGIEAGKLWSPTTFHALGYAWLASDSLSDAFTRLSRYAKVVNNSLDSTWEQHGTNYHFYISSTEIVAGSNPIGADAAIVSLVSMCRMLLGDSWSPLEIHRVMPSSESAVQLEAFVGGPIYYNAERAYLVVDRLDAEKNLATGNTELRQANEKIVMEYLSHVERGNIAARIQIQLTEALPNGGCNEEEMAKFLGLSVRSLQRRLAEDGLSYSGIMKQTRQELAEGYIRNSNLSLNEIAYLLGFSEQANFTRAFKRWYGSSPSVYRSQQLDKVPA